MKSLLFQEGATPFEEPELCEAGRLEVPIQIRKDGRVYTFIARDRLMPEDPYLVLVKASAFSIQTGEAYSGTPPSRAIRDFLIKQTAVI